MVMNFDKMNWVFPILKEIIDEQYISFANIIDLAEDLLAYYNFSSNNLPFEINLLDSIHLKEPNYSSMLAAILEQYDSGRKHTFLISFFRQLLFLGIDVVSPNIETEVLTDKGDRIDILVWEKGVYGIIIENKIFNAPSTTHQIGKYIDFVLQNKAYDLCINQVYVTYLLSDININSYRYDNNIWIGNDNISYKKRFTKRTTYIDFKHNILLWLKEVVLSLCKGQAASVKFAVLQLIDCLEGEYELRKRNKIMTEKMEEFLSDHLQLKENYVENYKSIDDKLSQLNELQTYVKELHANVAIKMFKSWADKLKAKYESKLSCKVISNGGGPYMRIAIPYKNTKEYVLIELQHYESVLYLGIAKDENKTHIKKLQKLASESLSSIGDLNVIDKYGWFCNIITDINHAYSDTCKLIELVRGKLL